MTLREHLLINPLVKYQNNIFYEKDLQSNNVFEGIYLKLRIKENRIHSDHVVKNLPEQARNHPHHKEWEMRKSTLQELIKYLKASGASSVLELGCGNGWLAHNLAMSLNAEICAVDVNETELLQGARVFNGQKNLCFVYANIFSFIFKPKKFDTIILGSSIQYFQDLKNLFATLLDLMNPGGTIYIADSPFYTTQEKADAAKKRSHKYFNSLGFPEMANQYFHHTFSELENFNCTIRYNPRSISSLIRRKILQVPLSVFPIIAIKD